MREGDREPDNPKTQLLMVRFQKTDLRPYSYLFSSNVASFLRMQKKEKKH